MGVGDGTRGRSRRALPAGVATFAAVIAIALVPRSAASPLGAPGAATPSPSPTAVAWLDERAVEVEPSPPEARPAATACRSADIVFDLVDAKAAAGTQFHLVEVHNAGTGRCTLAGRPSMSRVDPASGRRVAVPTHEAMVPFEPNLVPATVDPGEQAAVGIATYGGCLDGRPSVVYRDLVLRLPDGGQLRVPGTLDATCGVGLGQWYRVPPPPAVAPNPFAGLVASIEAPASVRVGGTLVYVVVLGNPGDRDVPFSPCPNYSQFLSYVKTGGYYRLNCAVPGVPAHGSVRFAMRMPVPWYGGVAATPGPVPLDWSIQSDDGTGPRATATVVIEG
jgi:hypothetical protein